MDDQTLPDGIFGILRADTPFRGIFPDGFVPLKSLVPFIPREEGSPLCYEVDASRLTDEQRLQLATDLFQRWNSEWESVEAEIAYIADPGLPLQLAWFRGFTVSGFDQLLPLLGLSSDRTISDDDAIALLRSMVFDEDDNG